MVKLFFILIFLTINIFARDLNIAFDKSYIYQKSFIKKNRVIPRLQVIPTISGFQIVQADYKNFFKLKLYYELSDKTRVKNRYEGKYWLISQKQIKRLQGSQKVLKSARDELLSTYKKALKDSGATLYKSRLNPTSSVIFNINNIWGRFQAYSDRFEIKAVEVQPFKQTLEINPDKFLAKLQKGKDATIDFMKPMPGFKKSKIREYKNSKLNFKINQNGQKELKKIIGKEVKVEYEIIDPKNSSYSYLEILKNYESLLESFGAKILGKNFPSAQSSYSYLANRGDGQELYSVVQAYNTGAYTIRFFVPNN